MKQKQIEPVKGKAVDVVEKMTMCELNPDQFYSKFDFTVCFDKFTVIAFASNGLKNHFL